MKLNNEKGVALAFTLFIMMILLGLSSLFVLRTIQESRLAARERAEAKSFYLAEAATNSGLEGLDTLINNYMLNTIGTTNPSVVISQAQGYVSSGDAIGFLVYAVKNSGTPMLTLNGTQAEYQISPTVLGGGTYQYQIVFTEKSNPVATGPDSWDFPFYYRLEASSEISSSDKDIVLSGDFTVQVQRDNFAKYALFTNEQTMPNGTNVWFTNKTNFNGPMHTNGRYNFYGNPSGTFNGGVTQEDLLARFYNSGSSISMDDDNNGTIDVPIFNAGYTRAAPAVTLSSPSQQQDIIDQATAGNSYGSNGIYLPNSSGALTGGIYVRGDSTINLSVDGSNNAVYTITQGSTTKTITVNKSTNQTTVVTAGTPVTYNGIPDGVDDVGTIIYVRGDIDSLSGTVQDSTELTISSRDDIVIQDDLTYSSYTPGSGTPGTVGYVPPHADGAQNLLGLVAWEGNVRVGTSAPDDVNIHATILAKTGEFQVDSYDSTGIGPRGIATLLGGVISDYYGAFGQFNGSTGAQISGYGRNFVYDERMSSGSAPPYFPSLNTFIAFTNDITDKMVWQEGNT